LYRTILTLTAWLPLIAVASAQQTREQKVRADRKKVEAEGFWIYNDLARGFAEAKKSSKPLLVVLRCIPCVECVKLDDDLVNQDRRVRPLLEKFVCVRIISTNGLDLSLFQFDYDQSFAAFLLNADGTIYGRFGTRSHRTSWADDVSVEGLAKALQGALELHADYPNNKSALARKKGPTPAVSSPEKYPLLKGRYTAQLDEKGVRVVQSCIHCHQIGDAQRQLARDGKQPLAEELLFPYPHPKSQGLILDPRARATVLRVEKDSPASAAGFAMGDVILTLAGQPLLSVADVQWVLHRAAPQGAALKAQVQRGARKVELTLELPAGWRRRDDTSWRVSNWGLRRMATGGMLLEVLPAAERNKAGVEEGSMALRVKYLGQNGPHAAAKRAGFRPGDVIVSFDEQTDLRREADVLAHALTKRKAGEQVAVTVLRGGKKVELKLPMQE
jgi:hypothetical protein